MVSIRKRRSDETGRLHALWHAAVAATHGFLSPADFETIGAMVRDHYLPDADLWVAAGEGDVALAFMGLTGGKVDALFVDPHVHGKGVGRALIAHADALAGPLSVDVNEQNESGLGFYRRLGFAVVGRSPLDDSGMPYPILHLAAAAKA